MCDVALDPYTSHGQDGLVNNSYVLNDETVEILIKQSLLQAEMGCDVIAPSDMMDGRIGKIRRSLDKNGYKMTQILSYAIKYADFVTYSYHPVKPITTGEGGAILTNDKFINDKIKYHFNVHSRATLLEDEITQFKSKEVSLQIIEFENQKLKQQLDDYLVSKDLIYAKIIIDNNSPYLKSFIINKGSRDGIKVGMVVLDQKYLVGKVIEVKRASPVNAGVCPP